MDGAYSLAKEAHWSIVGHDPSSGLAPPLPLYVLYVVIESSLIPCQILLKLDETFAEKTPPTLLLGVSRKESGVGKAPANHDVFCIISRRQKGAKINN